MKNTINIYVEGQGEIRFFSTFINSKFGYEFEHPNPKVQINMRSINEGLVINIRPFNLDFFGGGFDGRKIRDAANEVLVNREKGETNIFILDADTEHHRPAGGFFNRKKYLEDLKSEFEIDFHFFLIPDHGSSGNLESLLHSLISENGLPFYSCLTNYSTCLSTISQANMPVGLTHIDDFNKKKFEWYVFNMLGNGHKTTLTERDYGKSDLWNLDSDSLMPLLSFLRTHLPNM
jgi:hypothetical protein